MKVRLVENRHLRGKTRRTLKIQDPGCFRRDLFLISPVGILRIVGMDHHIKEIDVIDILIEFLEVGIHQILFCRNLYPQSIFVLRKMYNVPVHVSKHPDLNKYITESLRSARELARGSLLQSVAVCFYDSDNQPMERFVFDILNIQEKFKPQDDYDDPYLIKLCEGLRAFCLRVSTANFKSLPPRSSFQVHILTTEQGSETLANDPRFEDFPWVELEPQERELANSELLPIRTIEADFLKLQLYREATQS